MASKKLKLSSKEFVWYIIAGALAAWGITYIVLGLVIDYGSLNPEINPLLSVQTDFINTFGLSFFHWGLIITSIGALLATLVLVIFASSHDREVEKQTRRAQRKINFSKEEETVVDAEVK